MHFILENPNEVFTARSDVRSLAFRLLRYRSMAILNTSVHMDMDR